MSEIGSGPEVESSVSELNDLCRQLAECKTAEQILSAQKKENAEQKELIETKILKILEDNDLTSFKSPSGQAIRSCHTSVKVPKTDADRKVFFDELKSRGIFDTMITVNSRTLNSFYKEEFEKAVAEGRDSCDIPGLTEVMVTPKLSFRKAS